MLIVTSGVSGGGPGRWTAWAWAGSLALTISCAIGVWVASGLVLYAAAVVFGEPTALVVHLAAAPLLAGAATLLAGRHRPVLRPAASALVLLSVVVSLDALVLAPLVERGYGMFASVARTWAPLVLVFMASWGAGHLLRQLAARDGDEREVARRFLARRRIAVAGVSRDEADFSRRLLRDLAQRGYDVVPVNPALSEVAGARCYARVQDIRPPPEALLLLTPPPRSELVVRDALAAGVRHVWFHRGAGAGSASPGAVAACEAHGVRPVVGLCPYMVLPGAGAGHRLHGRVRRWTVALAR